jgi:hypothetical protein
LQAPIVCVIEPTGVPSSKNVCDNGTPVTFHISTSISAPNVCKGFEKSNIEASVWEISVGVVEHLAGVTALGIRRDDQLLKVEALIGAK